MGGIGVRHCLCKGYNEAGLRGLVNRNVDRYAKKGMHFGRKPSRVKTVLGLAGKSFHRLFKVKRPFDSYEMNLLTTSTRQTKCSLQRRRSLSVWQGSSRRSHNERLNYCCRLHLPVHNLRWLLASHIALFKQRTTSALMRRSLSPRLLIC